MRIRQLRRALPETIVLPTHNHTSYQFDYVEPFLADGQLTGEERGAIEASERDLFDEECQSRAWGDTGVRALLEAGPRLAS